VDKNIEELRDVNLELDELKRRKEEIKKKAQEHRSATTEAELRAATAEADKALAEGETINAKIKELEARKQELATATQNQNQNRGEYLNMENQRTETPKIDIRTAFAKYVLFNSAQRKDAKPNEAELRALGVSTTTTSETFVEASANADGINNGGIFIPQEIMLDILREQETESPIYRDIVTTAIKGKIKFPYRISKTGAKKKAELTQTDNENVEWAILSGSTGNYTDSIVITFEEEAMAIEEFTPYLISLIGESMRELLINDYIYGDGNNDSVKGITYQAIDAKYATADKADYRKIIEAGIKKLPVKKRAGAKIYLASDIYDGLTFEKDDLGNYILPVLNGGGLTKMSSFPVEMDENLNAGDFIIGNLGKWYKANINKTMELGLDVSHQKRTKTYTTHMMVTAIPVPSSIVYGKENK
jgi:HK97 family phage major capsid protein